MKSTLLANLGYFMEDNFEELTEELQEDQGELSPRPFKGNLRDRSLVTTENIQKASILAMYSAGLHQDSTGKDTRATFEAAYTMCKAIKTYHSITGNKVGIKISEAYARRKTQFDIIRRKGDTRR